MCAWTFGCDLSTLRKLLPYRKLSNIVVSITLRHTIQKQLHGQGIGRHTLTEILHIAFCDMASLSRFLGDCFTFEL